MAYEIHNYASCICCAAVDLWLHDGIAFALGAVRVGAHGAVNVAVCKQIRSMCQRASFYNGPINGARFPHPGGG